MGFIDKVKFYIVDIILKAASSIRLVRHESGLLILKYVDSLNNTIQ